MNKALTLYNKNTLEFINEEFEIKILTNDCLFTEGPVWNKEGYYLFSDTTANVIYKILPQGDKEVFLQDAGTGNPEDPDLKPGQAGSNGLAYDKSGELLICQHGGHAIARYDGHQISPFITSFENKPFNSPNDLVFHNDQRLYFSDPPYGLKDGKLNPSKFQSFAGVYCWNNGYIQLVCDKYQYPNGVCLTHDQKHLFICSNKPFEKFISIYDTSNNLFEKILAEENSDGIECDRNGNIYLCNKDGLIILDKDGQRSAVVELPAIPSNLCWGGANMKDLLITAREYVLLIKGFLK
jgi:gluconolactonase